MKREGMDNDQHLLPFSQDRDRNTVTDRPTPGSARQLARKKGLAWVSAITLGAGAASALGAAAIVMSLPSVTAATSTKAAAAAASTSTTAGSTKQASLTSAAAPTTTSAAPVATSGAS